MKSVGRGLMLAVGLVAAMTVTLLIFRLPVFGSLGLIAHGALGDRFALARTAVKATPLLLCGLGVAVSWRAGMFNIGGEGQYLMGALLGAWVAKILVPFGAHASHWVAVPILLAAAIGGAVWAGIAGVLYVKRGVDVVIGTILLNFIALQVLLWAVSGPLQEHTHTLPLSEQLPDSAMLWRPNLQTDLHLGVVMALIVAVIVHIFLFRSVFGFKMRLCGESEEAARNARWNVAQLRLAGIGISGALCGLAGGIDYLGVAGQIGSGFSQNWGFLAIPVALIGNLYPASIILSAAFFGALFAGSENLERFTAGGTSLIYVIQGVAVLGFIVAQSISSRRREAPARAS